MKRETLKKAIVTSFVVDKLLNWRDDYDLPAMREQIRKMGRIVEPLHVEKASNKVLKGNRRAAAGQEEYQRILAIPENERSTEDVHLLKALENVEVFYYTDLTDRERTEVMLDQGGQKPLSRVEIVKAVWRLQRQMYSEREIILLLYMQLAMYTKNMQKAQEASQLPEGKAREDFLKKWLHGTVGNYIMAAGSMGEFIRRQLILTDTKAERKLSEDEQKEFKFEVTRDRVNKLTTAKKKDLDEKSGGKGWDPDKGGEHFNAQIEEFIKEESGQGTSDNKRVTKEQMESTALAMNSQGMRLSFLSCAGKINDGDRSKLDQLDTEYARRDKVFETLLMNVEKIGDEKVQKLVRSILHDLPAGVEEQLKTFLVKAAPAS